jgi:hypothetical protein
MNVIWNACIEKKDKINKKCGNRHQTLKKPQDASKTFDSGIGSFFLPQVEWATVPLVCPRGPAPSGGVTIRGCYSI